MASRSGRRCRGAVGTLDASGGQAAGRRVTTGHSIRSARGTPSPEPHSWAQAGSHRWGAVPQYFLSRNAVARRSASVESRPELTTNDIRFTVATERNYAITGKVLFGVGRRTSKDAEIGCERADAVDTHSQQLLGSSSRWNQIILLSSRRYLPVTVRSA